MRVGMTVGILLAMTSTAFAGGGGSGGGFDIVIPYRRGIPIIINGIDASYTVIEGEWGLGKNDHVQPTIYGGRYIDSEPNVGHYYPSLGHMPGYGRLEIEPPANRRLPKPAESYHQSWSARSLPLPAQSDPPVDAPPVIYAPQYNEFQRDHRRAPRRGPR